MALSSHLISSHIESNLTALTLTATGCVRACTFAHMSRCRARQRVEHARSSPHSLLLCAVLAFYLILSFYFCSTRFHLLLCQRPRPSALP